MLKREAVKYIRDGAKAAYEKGDCCYVTGTKENLELHHFYSVSQLYKKWVKKKGYNPEDILEHRDEFIEEHYNELYNEVVTLCKGWHRSLHGIYGESPVLSTAPKQKRWLDKKREQYAAKNEIMGSGEVRSEPEE